MAVIIVFGRDKINVRRRATKMKLREKIFIIKLKIYSVPGMKAAGIIPVK